VTRHDSVTVGAGLKPASTTPTSDRSPFHLHSPASACWLDDGPFGKHLAPPESSLSFSTA